MDTEEESLLVEQERIKSEEGEEDLRLKAEEEARLTDGVSLKVEDHGAHK